METEIVRLSHLRDRASEKGRRKEYPFFHYFVELWLNIFFKEGYAFSFLADSLLLRYLETNYYSPFPPMNRDQRTLVPCFAKGL